MSDGPLGGGDPIGAGSIEWTPFRYRELEEGELFWFEQTKSASNGPCRKLNDRIAIVLKEDKEIEVNPQIQVYQKEY